MYGIEEKTWDVVETCEVSSDSAPDALCSLFTIVTPLV